MPFLQKLTRIDRTYANFRRALEIGDALLKFGFSDLAILLYSDRSPFRRMLSRVSASPAAAELPRPARVRLLLQELGPTFVKFGQVLASRPDLIPPEYVTELAKLQDKVPGEPWDVVRTVLTEAYGKAPEAVFKSIDHEPFAAASIGQAHHAVLPDGTPVMVKVRRPGVERKIRVDLEILYFAAAKLEAAHPDLAGYRPTAVVEEFGHALRRELDFTVEGANAARFGTVIRDQPGVYAPKIYTEWTAPQVLVEEEIRGDSAKAVLADPALRGKYDLKSIARHGIDSMMAQIFVHGFFHADPHAGNLILCKDDVLCFIDFGMMGRISETERADFIRAVRAILRNDIAVLARTVRRLAVPIGIPADHSTLERDLADLVDENLYLPLAQMSLAKILEKLMATLVEQRLALLPDLYVLFKALITAETVAKSFDPELPVMEILSGAIRHTVLPGLRLRRRAALLWEEAEDLTALARRFPQTAARLFDRIERNDLRLQVDYRGMDGLKDTLARSVHHLACAVVLAALIVGSSLVVLSGIPPLLRGIPVLGVAGFVASAALAVLLLISSVRR